MSQRSNLARALGLILEANAPLSEGFGGGAPKPEASPKKPVQVVQTIFAKGGEAGWGKKATQAARRFGALGVKLTPAKADGMLQLTVLFAALKRAGLFKDWAEKQGIYNKALELQGPWTSEDKLEVEKISSLVQSALADENPDTKPYPDNMYGPLMDED